MDEDQRERLVNLLLDGLDDLYDQTFGGTATTAESWLGSLLYAAGLAFEGTPFETRLLEAASAVFQIVRSGGEPKERGKAALAATDSLRTALATPS